MNILEERCVLHKCPWIFYSHGEHNHTFYSLLERRVVHQKCINEMVGKDIVCSMHGWFILSNQSDRRICQLFNPVSMATIQLPLLPKPSYDFCTLSCDPNNQNCVVMLIKSEEGSATCYFCRPGDDDWTKKVLVLERKHVSSADSVLAEKKIVAVENLGGRAIFLSPSSSGLLRSTENLGIQENTIYFTRPSDPRIYSFGMQKKFLSFSLPCANVEKNLVQAEWILLVSPNAPCKLDCKPDIISPLQIKKITILSIRKDRPPLVGGGEKLHRFTDNDWSELPHDVLLSIVEKLSCVNCSRIATVCKSWRSVITYVPKNLHDYPVFLHMSSSSVEVFHFMNESRYSAGIELFFLNHLTFEIIEIPHLLANAHSLCFTSLSTSSTCSVLAICESNSQPFVYYIHRRVMIWRRVGIPVFEADFEITLYNNPVFHEGVFYWIWGCGKLCTYDPMKKKVKHLVEPPYESVCSYLFESGKILMSVWAERHKKWVRVYKLDEASITWKEVNTLNNKVIFLSRNSSLVTEIQGLEDMICFNCFVDDNQPLVYSLKTSELRAYGDGHHTIQDFCDIPEYHIKNAWIMPNINQHSVWKLNWLDPWLSPAMNLFFHGAALALAFVKW